MDDNDNKTVTESMLGLSRTLSTAYNSIKSASFFGCSTADDGLSYDPYGRLGGTVGTDGKFGSVEAGTGGYCC